MFNCDGAILFGLLLSAMSTVHLYVCQVAHERGFHSFPFFHFFFGLGLHLLCFASHSIPPASAHSTRNLNWGRFRRRNNKSGGGSGGGSGGSFFSFPGASASSGSDCKFSKFVHSQEHEPPFSFPFIQALMVSDKRIGRRMSCWWVKGFGPAKRKDPKQSKQAANFKIQKR